MCSVYIVLAYIHAIIISLCAIILDFSFSFCIDHFPITHITQHVAIHSVVRSCTRTSRGTQLPPQNRGFIKFIYSKCYGFMLLTNINCKKSLKQKPQRKNSNKLNSFVFGWMFMCVVYRRSEKQNEKKNYNKEEISVFQLCHQPLDQHNQRNTRKRSEN